MVLKKATEKIKRKTERKFNSHQHAKWGDVAFISNAIYFFYIRMKWLYVFQYIVMLYS